MNTSGEAADQVVRMSLEVGEAALKITGVGAKQLAVLLYAVLKEQKKTKGRARLETLVRSGKPLTVYSVKESDLRQFVTEAKRYGILYCAVRNPKGSIDGMVDVVVKEEDAPRINRIVERFKFASVTEAAQIKTEIEKSREEKSRGKKDFSKMQDMNLMYCVYGVVEPNLRDPALLEHFGCKTPKELASILFEVEAGKIAGEIAELSGVGEDSEDEVKNS